MLSVSTLIAFFIRAAFDTCDRNLEAVDKSPKRVPGASPNPLRFMKSKLVLLVSHELSLSGKLNSMVLRYNIIWVFGLKDCSLEKVIILGSKLCR